MCHNPEPRTPTQRLIDSATQDLSIAQTTVNMTEISNRYSLQSIAASLLALVKQAEHPLIQVEAVKDVADHTLREVVRNQEANKPLPDYFTVTYSKKTGRPVASFSNPLAQESWELFRADREDPCAVR